MTPAWWVENGNFHTLFYTNTQIGIAMKNIIFISFRNVLAFLAATILSFLVLDYLLSVHEYEESQRIERVQSFVAETQEKQQ